MADETPFIVLGICLLVVAVGLLLAIIVMMYRKYVGYNPGLAPPVKINPMYSITKHSVGKKKQTTPITFDQLKNILAMDTQNPSLSTMTKDEAMAQRSNLLSTRTQHNRAIKSIDENVIDELKEQPAMIRGHFKAVLQGRADELKESMIAIDNKFGYGSGLAGGMAGQTAPMMGYEPGLADPPVSDPAYQYTRSRGGVMPGGQVQAVVVNDQNPQAADAIAEVAVVGPPPVGYTGTIWAGV